MTQKIYHTLVGQFASLPFRKIIWIVPVAFTFHECDCDFRFSIAHLVGVYNFDRIPVDWNCLSSAYCSCNWTHGFPLFRDDSLFKLFAARILAIHL